MSDRTETPRPRRTLRRIGAVLAGMLAIVILSTATDSALHAIGIAPSTGEPWSDAMLLLALIYRIVYTVAGSYLTARLAPDRPMQHALVLGLLGLLASAAGAATMWDVGPAWYSLGVVAIAMPCAWAGGKLRGSPASAEASM